MPPKEKKPEESKDSPEEGRSKRLRRRRRADGNPRPLTGDLSFEDGDETHGRRPDGDDWVYGHE